MSSVYALTIMSLILLINGATHDEIPQCGLTGVYKTRQSVIESPNYPDNYPQNTCWDYVIRSPYRCPTKFHIQFLDFFLESSRNCSNDYLAIGLENDSEDMDILCGQVIGIKKYATPDGVLRLRFFSDDSPWTTGKGFKLLITRLACEREDLLRDILDQDQDDTSHLEVPADDLVPPHAKLPELFRNFSQQDQHKPFNLPPFISPNQLLPGPPPPNRGDFYEPDSFSLVKANRLGENTINEQPCSTSSPIDANTINKQLNALNDQFLQNVRRPEGAFRSNDAAERAPNIDPVLTSSDREHCCASSFRQKRFYLSSPGFPRTVFTSLLPTHQRDCLFFLEKSSHNICRLRIEFKFFDFGQGYSGTGARQGNIDVAISSSRDVCTEDFLEIDRQRFCGCRTGYVYTGWWGPGKKAIRMRMGYSGLPSSGFLLDIFQEECRGTQFVDSQLIGQNEITPQNELTTTGAQPLNDQYSSINANPYQQQSAFGQQPLPFLSQNSPLQQQQQQQLPFLPPQSFQPNQFSGLWQNPLYFPNNPPLNPLFAPQFPSPINPISLQQAQFRRPRAVAYAKSVNSQQPVSVVETNSTRKEFYYFDGEEAFARARINDEPDDLQHRLNARVFSVQKSRCTFEMADVFKLSVDGLWLTKPTCYAPTLRNWFGNFLG